ncbi:MAG: hypothetical protein GXP03_08055 [Alphaproteobacteria bacterium]|nr:hypothetical protein [Alphaproteobacteria bacterium]
MKLILMAAILATGTLAAQAASAKECRKSYFQGSNAAWLTGRYKDVAKDNAVISWGLRVTTSLGPVYADWDNATDKSFRCVTQSGRYKCTARARPCTGS